MNTFISSAGLLVTDPLDLNYHYWWACQNFPLALTVPAYLHAGRINSDGEYGGPVGTYGWGSYSFVQGGTSLYKPITGSLTDPHTPIYDEAYFTLSDLSYFATGTVYLTVGLHTFGTGNYAGIENDLWLFGNGIKPILLAKAPRVLKQYQIGALPTA